METEVTFRESPSSAVVWDLPQKSIFEYHSKICEQLVPGPAVPRRAVKNAASRSPGWQGLTRQPVSSSASESQDMIWSYCPVDRQDGEMTGFWGSPQDSQTIFRIVILIPQSDRTTGFMVILEIDPPYLVTLVQLRITVGCE